VCSTPRKPRWRNITLRGSHPSISPGSKDAQPLAFLKAGQGTQAYGSAGHTIIVAPVLFGPAADRVGTLQIAFSNDAVVRESKALATNAIIAASVIVASVVGLLLFLLRWLVSQPVRALCGTMLSLAGGDTEVVIPNAGRDDELGEMGSVVDVFRRNAIQLREVATEREAAERISREEKQRAMLLLASEFEERIQGLVDTISGSTDIVASAAEEMTTIAGQTNGRSKVVADASQEASHSVTAVAAGLEELTSTITEINLRWGFPPRSPSRALIRSSAPTSRSRGSPPRPRRSARSFR